MDSSPQTPTSLSLESLPFPHWGCGQGSSFKGNEPIRTRVRTLQSTITSLHLPSLGPGAGEKAGKPRRKVTPFISLALPNPQRSRGCQSGPMAGLWLLPGQGRRDLQRKLCQIKLDEESSPQGRRDNFSLSSHWGEGHSWPASPCRRK